MLFALTLRLMARVLLNRDVNGNHVLCNKGTEKRNRGRLRHYVAEAIRIYTSVLAELPPEVPALLRGSCGTAAEIDLLPRRLFGRLASRAARICSGVRTSGSERSTFSLARET